MNESIVTLYGFLDEDTVPGNTSNTTARFRLTISPSDEKVDEALLPCVITDPALAFTALTELVPGDELRLTGHLQLPQSAGQPMCLYVLTLETITPAPERTTSTVHIERNGPYVYVFDADHSSVPVWTESGKIVGVAEDPAAIAQLLADYERRPSTGSS
ncbi:hypothetical protein ABZ604_32905 [Streptomyces sp. NPDC012473]|uniref:hypothetical protein n=1 Tax=Streptomyces sp. NPDC012473 TaxID=3156676 RepID=UPI0033E00159